MNITSSTIVKHGLSIVATSAALFLGASAVAQTTAPAAAPTEQGASPTPQPGQPGARGEQRMYRQGERGGHHFKGMDTDGDGMISRAEFDAAGKQASERRAKFFEMADANKDGKLSREEMQAFRQAHRRGPRSDQPGAPAPKPQG